MELDPRYADVIVRRWQEYTGKPAMLAPENRTYQEVALERAEKLKGPAAAGAGRAEGAA